VSTGDAGWLALKDHVDAMVTYTVPAYNRGAEADNTIFYSYQGAGWLDAAQTLGIAYKMTGNSSYSYPATDAISADDYYPTRNIPVAATLIFDWLYDYAPYTTAKNALIATVNGWYDAWSANGYQRTGPGQANYFGGHLLGFGLWGMATYGDNARSPEINTAIRTLWNSQVVPMFVSGQFQGGYSIQGFNYGPTHFVRLLEYANVVLTATGENIYPDNIDNIVKITYV
jgi:hypothetical protein